MVKKRVNYSSSFKSNVAFAFKHDNTICQLSSHFKVRPTIVAKWKYQLLDRVDEIFLNDHKKYRQYDEPWNQAKTIDPLGNETNYRYDNLGRKISETNAEGGVTKFAYWHDGQMQSLTDPVGNKTIWVYNLLGRVSREIITLDKKVIARFFYYDANGNIVTKIDRNNRVTSWTYDKLNRATSEIWHSNWRSFIDNKQPIKKFTTTYNNKGKIESTEDGYNKFTFSYGIFGNEIKQNQNLSDLGKPIEFNFVTNINGQKTEKILNVDGKVDHKNQYEFDNLNRTTKISQTIESNVKAVNIQYDNLGQLVKQTRFDSDKPIIVTKNKFDQSGRLTNISHTGNGKTYADYDLTWDNANRITDFDFTYLNGPAKKNESKYRYDKTSQLIAANYNFMQNEMYDFDLNGNRKKAKIQDKNESYKTGEYNRLLSDENYRYEYDAEGNRIAKISKDGKTTKYFWDHRNRLVKVQTPTETVDYIYDYQNRLTVRKQDKNETIFVHDDWQVLLTFDLTKKFITEYFWGSQQDELICYGENWTLCDHLNTIRDIIKSDGTVVSHLEYNAFGKLISETKKDPFFFGYTGKLFDKVSDLQWNINRWYDSNIGKWMSEDPIGFNGCDNNLYRYVGNVLLNLIDPDGELPIVSIIVGASCVACYGAMASMLSTAWDICWNSEGPIAFSTCMIDKINQMESSLDTYSWTVINGACLCCGGGIGKAASKHFIPKLLNKYTASKIAKCEAIYIAYKALNCEGCRHAGITVAECVVRAACLTSEMLGRSEYLLNKCDYFLPGSISFGSKRKERAHLQHLETTVVNTLKRCKRCASL